MTFYTALGDSTTAGLSAAAPQLAYPSLVMQNLRGQRREAGCSVLAQNGWTSSRLAAAVPYASGALRRSTTVTVWIGGNDLLQAAAGIVSSGAPVQTALGGLLVTYTQNLERIVTYIRSENKNARIILCTQFNPFPHSPVAVQGVALLNRATAKSAKRLGTGLAPVHKWFAGAEPALIDGYRSGRIEDALRPFRRPIHPNNAGHALIARHLAPYIR